MKIILIHNKYKQAGGEDLVFQSEGELLRAHGHQIEQILFDNKEIKTTLDKGLSGLTVIYNPNSSKIVKKKSKNFNLILFIYTIFFHWHLPLFFLRLKSTKYQ
jgi:hypothetical protein